MKNKYFFCFILLLVQYETMAQGALRITWPLDRTVFQRDANGGTDIWYSGEFGYHQLATGSNDIQFTIYELSKQGGTRLGNVVQQPISGGQAPIISTGLTTIYGNVKTFIGKIGRLNTGWYELEVRILKTNSCGQTTAVSALRSVKFGVGDVFMIAGQSNASGYTAGDDNVTAHGNALDMPDAVNILNGSYLSYRQNISLSDEEKIKMPKALPINATNNDVTKRQKFDAIEITPTSETPSTHPTQNEISLFPNGQSSWTWGPMAYKMYQNGNQVPMMYFNAALPGSSSEFWDPLKNGNVDNPHWVYGQFRDALLMYGHIFGVKKVLWHQGESDSFTSTADYQNRIGRVIQQAKNDLGHQGLAWNISTATYDAGSRNPPTLPSIQTAQQNLANSNYQGPNTDSPNVTRASTKNVHFTGASLNDVGDRWAATNLTDGTPFTGGQQLQQLTVSVSPNDINKFRLQAPSGFQRYFWVKNENGLYNAEITNTNHTQNYFDVPNSLSTVEYYTCYMSNQADDNATNGFNMRLFVSQSFVVPNDIDAGQILDVDFHYWEVPKVYSTKITKITSKNVDWVVSISSNAQDWLSTAQVCGSDGLVEFNLIAQENNTGAERPATVSIVGSNSETEVINVTQLTASGGGGCPEPNLSSFTPINPSGEWQGWGNMHNNFSIEGNTLNINNETFSNGIGTHAGSTIIYNLNGQYNYLTGLVGRDYEARNCDCGTQQIRFFIKDINNNTLFDSELVGNYQPAKQIIQSGTTNPYINVSGMTQIKLIVEDGGDNFWGDHADWVNMKLSVCANSCTTQAPTPQNVGSSNPSITAGQSSTLQATCSVGTPTWGNGTNVVSPSVTTTYYVNCVNGACPISATAQTTVTVTGGGSCSAVTDGLAMGIWNVTGQQLVARKINNYNAFYLTQRINNSPETFAIRASEMLLRSDVALYNGSYSSLVGCFNHQYSGYGGLATPNLANPISLNNGTFYLNPGEDGTPIYTQSAPPPANTCNGCTGYLDGAWCPYGGGWAKSGSNGAVNIDVYIDGQLVQANMAPNYDRPDVGGYYGFIYSYPTQYMNGQNHSLVYKFAGTNTSLVNAPQTFNCTSNNMRMGQIETSASAQVPDEMQIYTTENSFNMNTFNTFVKKT